MAQYKEAGAVLSVTCVCLPHITCRFSMATANACGRERPHWCSAYVYLFARPYSIVTWTQDTIPDGMFTSASSV